MIIVSLVPTIIFKQQQQHHHHHHHHHQEEQQKKRMKMIVKPQVVLVPYPAQGHLTPMVRLARALYGHGFRPVVAVPDFIHGRMRNTGDDWVSFLSVPTGLGEGDKDFFAIDRAMENFMPAHFECVLEGLQSEGEVVCVVVDLLASWAIAVAVRCGIRTAGFWPAMLATYQVISAIPELIRSGLISECGIPLYQHLIEEEEEKVSKIVILPTKPKLSTKDLPWLVGSPASQKSRFKFWLSTMERASTLPWLLVNSFPQEDGQPDETSGHGNGRPRIFQIGPLLSSNKGPNSNSNPNPTMWEEDKSCLNWLELQPPNSVIYVSFGSWVGPIGHEKITEFALGLEATKRPFLWVLRDDAAWRNGLPTGFLDRAAGRGKVVSWAPQEAVLAHRAVGCYVTHCGWNSTVEGIRYGKRLVCYPISGDQFLNCNFIARVWGVGINPNGFGRRKIEYSVQRVMEGKEGKEIQERVLGLKQKVMGAKGSSTARDNLQLFVNAIRKAQKVTV